MSGSYVETDWRHTIELIVRVPNAPHSLQSKENIKPFILFQSNAYFSWYRKKYSDIISFVYNELEFVMLSLNYMIYSILYL